MRYLLPDWGASQPGTGLPVTPSWSWAPELCRGLTLLLALAPLVNGPLAAAGPPGRANQPWGLLTSWGEGPSSPEHSVVTLCQAHVQEGDFFTPIS